MAQWVLDLGLPPGSVCLNIGSSTGDFRKVEQPHIDRDFIKPVEAAGLRFVHCDMKRAEGVDEIGDVLDPKFRARLKRHGAQLIVCSNLLEHLTRPREFARACGELVVDGGYGLFSVPSSYPYHADPIDTLLRPSPEELAGFLPSWTLLRGTELDLGSYWEDLKRGGRPLQRLARHTLRVALPFYRPRQWRENASRLSWLWRRYRVSIIIVQKPAGRSKTASGGRKRGRRSRAASPNGR